MMKKEAVDAMTLQQACDYAVKQIVAQGDRCGVTTGSTFHCTYAADGMHCAVGWLLDEGNVELMRATGRASSLVECYPGFIPEIIKANSTIFDLLQNFHDAYHEEDRAVILYMLSRHIDTSGKHWQQWVEMGE